MLKSEIFNCSKRILFRTFYVPSKSTNLCSRFCHSETINPVKLAYSSYESTDIGDFELNNKCPIIIMHGLLGSKNNWNSLSKAIHSSTKRKIIAVDARNHGESPHSPEFNYPCLAEDIRYLMCDLKVPDATLLGHSMGGRSVMLFAMKYPELIKSLIVVDIAPRRTSSTINSLSEMFDAMMAIKMVENVPISKARKLMDEQLKTVLSDMYVRQFILTNLVEYGAGQFKWRVNLDALIQNFSNIINFELPPGRFDGPVLFIGGSESSFLKKDDHADIYDIFPKAEIKYIEGAGHWVHSEKPTEFLSLVCDFINRTKT